jgi:catechol 2,3-dioxygenase-like lactoylglutathione lyase family enzyme
MAFVLTTDSSRAREFYEGQLGLDFVSEDDFALVLRSKNVFLRIAKVKEFTAGRYTVLGWRVGEIEGIVRAGLQKGITFHRYEFIKNTELPIWDAPNGARVAWFSDPDGNVLSVSQHPEGT